MSIVDRKPTTKLERILTAEAKILRREKEELQAKLKALSEAAEGLPDYPLSWGLTPTEDRMLRTLHSKGRVTSSFLYEVVCNGRLDTPEPKIVDVLMCKIRAKIKHRGIEINTIWGVGYELADKSIKELNEATREGE